MTPIRRADHQLDGLIDEITIDCHDEDEALTGFEAAFDEAASSHAQAPSSASPSKSSRSASKTAAAN